MLADFLDMESSVIVSMHIQSVDQVKAIKTIKRKITDLDKMKIEEQKKAIRAGYDMDIIPSDLATYGNEAKKLLQELQSRNERMFLLTFIILNTAKCYFDSKGLKKLPSHKALQTEVEQLIKEKNELYNQYQTAKEEAQRLGTIRHNLEQTLGRKIEHKKEQER